MTTNKREATRKAAEIIEQNAAEVGAMIEAKAPDMIARADHWTPAGRLARPEVWFYFSDEQAAADFVKDYRAGRWSDVICGLVRWFKTPQCVLDGDETEGWAPIPHAWTVQIDTPTGLSDRENAQRFKGILEGLGVKPLDVSDIGCKTFHVITWEDDAVSQAALAEVGRRTGATVKQTSLSNRATAHFHVDLSTVDEKKVRKAAGLK